MQSNAAPAAHFERQILQTLHLSLIMFLYHIDSHEFDVDVHADRYFHYKTAKFFVDSSAEHYRPFLYSPQTKNIYRIYTKSFISRHKKLYFTRI
jgi:hypothetical protein